MFSGLLSQLNDVMRQASSTSNTLKKTLIQAKMNMGVADTAPDETSREYNPRLPSGPVASFPKSERFKEKPKQPLNVTDAIDLSTSISQDSDSGRGIAFSKQQRFKQEKAKEETLLYPKLDLVKKSKHTAFIAPLSEKEKSIMGKSTMSQQTAASQSIASLGPGTYTPNTITLTKTAVFPKEKRFAGHKQQYTDQIPLYPKDTFTKKRPPSAAVLKNKTIPNQKQISKQRQQEVHDRLRVLYWKAVPLEFDRLFKSSVGPIIKEDYFQVSKMTGVRRKCAMQMLIDRMNYLRGGFEYDISKELIEVPCAVVYRKSTPKSFKLPQHTPGPDDYYPKDDLTRPGLVGYTFAKQQQKAMTPEDGRDYDINYDFFKKVQNVVINSEHKHKRLTEQEIASLKRGPGFYDAIFSQVQRRPDIGVVKMPELTQINDRINNIYEKKQLNDGVYYPRYTAIDKNIPAPLYRQPANVQPDHLPQKVLFPEHWQFYDGDLNKVRAEVAKNVLIAGGMDFQQYNQYAKQVQSFKQFLNRQRQTPHVGEYEPSYKQIDPNVPVPDMEKMQERGLDPIVKQQGEVDGDNLLLNPDKPKPTIPVMHFVMQGFDIGKQLPREQPKDNSDEPAQGDVLILNPKPLEKKLPDVNFEKQIGRNDNQQQINEEGMEGNRLVLNPIYPDKHIPTVNIQKCVPREQPATEQQLQQVETVLVNPIYTQVDKRVKGFVDMERHSQIRLVPILRSIAKQSEQQPKSE